MNKKLIFLFLFAISLSFVSAGFFESFGKTQLCIMLNLSNDDCDNFWCQEIVECDYNSSLHACICTQIINQTIIVNNTNITSVDYYNKSEIDKLLNETKEGINLTNFNNSGVIENKTVKEYVDDKIKRVITNTDDKIDDALYGKKDSDFNPLWIVVGFLALIILGSFVLKGKNINFGGTKEEEIKPTEKPRNASRKIQTRKDLEKDDEIIKLKEELKKISEGKEESKKVEKDENTEEDDEDDEDEED